MEKSIRDGRCRVVIENVSPEIDCGSLAVKRAAGERVNVEADVFADSHDVIRVVLLFRNVRDDTWNEVPMRPLVNDRWGAEFCVEEIGEYVYTIKAWADRFQTWRRDMGKRLRAGDPEMVEFLIGADLIRSRTRTAPERDAMLLADFSERLRNPATTNQEKARIAMDDDLAALMLRYPDRALETTYSRELRVTVDEDKARFSAWYEFFPRSCAPEPGRHGTFKDCENVLPYVASLGFDVVYFPPIHPIGRRNRKGKNNSLECRPEDVGSPWAIGSEEGGHKDIHPALGTLGDFQELVAKARELGLEIALDIALQCSPDHPYVREHPDWFTTRPDGTVQYAENPPKKYQDIYPFNFECDDWRALWEELKSVFTFWIDQGIRIFRVDNPHTKPFVFWEWLLAEVKRIRPDAIFLAEAFTRPKVMARLAKLGFSQSYTYFAWRNTKEELAEYFTELMHTGVREYLRPNVWPNTPDILTEYLQFGGRPAFMSRLVLAATLASNYGIYGPAFELCEASPREPGSEEYLNSDKYEIRYRNRDDPGSLSRFITRINAMRRRHAAFRNDWSLRFHDVDNDQIVCYSKQSEDFGSVILVLVNLDPHHRQSGWVNLDLERLGLEASMPFQVHDLLTEARYLWHGPRNYVELDPQAVPASIFLIRRRIRTEKDFDYYL
jgi:starch synthase (maltosyl-transferring)